jgi:hypothetical protein
MLDLFMGTTPRSCHECPLVVALVNDLHFHTPSTRIPPVVELLYFVSPPSHLWVRASGYDNQIDKLLCGTSLLHCNLQLGPYLMYQRVDR